jgi:hypothetical protein
VIDLYVIRSHENLAYHNSSNRHKSVAQLHGESGHGCYNVSGCIEVPT